jgi:hypothetical protein
VELRGDTVTEEVGGGGGSASAELARRKASALAPIDDPSVFVLIAAGPCVVHADAGGAVNLLYIVGGGSEAPSTMQASVSAVWARLDGGEIERDAIGIRGKGVWTARVGWGSAVRPSWVWLEAQINGGKMYGSQRCAVAQF